ncbi:sensor histidine kinase [Legionella spiritensis]|uniref:sensor histidine kinase n=1 Tax=Legionella spiritensis TaxID=452 RepID=UPI000F6EE3E6|nr:HAMP domain-containing sensor histidine kinase [Legionella spiritensis]VEG91095.1 sensor histidine kinase [Legionella spiritensis]
MSKLTSTARKTYVGLVIGNLFIILALMLTMQYFYYMTVRPVVPPDTVHGITKMIYLLKNRPESNWSKIMRRQAIPWTKLTVSKTPEYQNNALLSIQPPHIFDQLRQYKSLRMSVFIKEGIWLNITMMPPIPNQTGTRLAMMALIVILLAGMLFINYWAVNMLNQPVQTLIQSLIYSEDRDSWLPIPVTGNSDQKLIFEKINLLQDKVNKLLSNRTHVVTAISHDLRTPLTRLKLRAESLEKHPDFEKIMRDINDMDMMIRQSLDYFRDVSHEEKMQRFDMVAMLGSLCEDAGELKSDVRFESDVERLIYYGCVDLLKRAFSNLINNAVYYGGGAWVHLRQHPDKIEITIVDNGPGLKEEDRERAFIPFYRAESSRSRSTGGVGLGLTIAQEIMRQHRGDISLTNRPEGGLQVLVTLPK